MAGVELVRDVASKGRVPRNPQHSFRLRTKPWQIQPMLLAPVLPGETLTNALIQARTVSDPLIDKLGGWWLEYFIFYVKHRDLDERDIVTEMHMNPTANVDALRAAVNYKLHHPGVNMINWSALCLKRVVNEYFREDDEENRNYLSEGLPMASINMWTAIQSLKLTSEIPAGGNDHELVGENPVVPDHVPPGFENHFSQWEHMRALKLTDATFEDYLRSFGVKPPRETLVEDIHRPELLRYVREWTYPTNTVDPPTGVPTSAAVWSTSERLDKDRFFAEPGFIFGVQVARPKVYLDKQVGCMACGMDDAYAWLPAVLADQPYTSLKRYPALEGPLAYQVGGEYWVDRRDLFIYGDQYVNFQHVGVPDVGTNFVQLPGNDGETRFASEADGDAMFSGATPDKKYLRTDGVVKLTIQSRIVDTTP